MESMRALSPGNLELSVKHRLFMDVRAARCETPELAYIFLNLWKNYLAGREKATERGRGNDEES